jgi:hypothetical protein
LFQKLPFLVVAFACLVFDCLPRSKHGPGVQCVSQECNVQ